MSGDGDALAALFAWFAEEQCRGYAPAYERICAAVARDDEALRLVREAPPAAHLPPALLAAVHYLVLDGLEHPLAAVYAGRSDADPAPLFLGLCRDHRDEVARLLATRTIQTNDCGRSAVLGPALTWLAAGLEGPVALVDVGASAGLNLLADRYRLDYGDRGATGPADSPVQLSCAVVGGDPPIAPELGPFAERVGLDLAPVDLTDPDDARWLLACVWPGTGRFGRTAAAIELARAAPPRVVAGDAVAALPGILGELPAGRPVVALTTWSFVYLVPDERVLFVALLDEAARDRPVAWLLADTPEVVAEFAGGAGLGATPGPVSWLGCVRFDGGRRGEAVAVVHQHGTWLDWRAGPPLA